MQSQSIHDRLIKLKQLAEQGYQYEAEAAHNKLKQLCDKYNIQIEELSQAETHQFQFHYKNQNEFQLFFQIYANFFQIEDETISLSHNPSHKYFAINLTNLQYIEFNEFWQFYRKKFKRDYRKKLRELKNYFLSAWIQKQQLTVESNDDTQKTTISEEELNSILNYMNEIDHHPFIAKHKKRIANTKS